MKKNLLLVNHLIIFLIFSIRVQAGVPDKSKIHPVKDTRLKLRLTKKMSAHMLKMMRDHLQAVQEIVKTMGNNDFEGMKKSSLRLAGPSEMVLRCALIGKGTPGLVNMCRSLHHAGNLLAKKAENKDYKGFVKQLEVSLNTCNSCHSTYRQHIVTEEEFAKY